MPKATVSTTLDMNLATILEEDAIKQNITVSHLLRNIIKEKYELAIKKEKIT